MPVTRETERDHHGEHDSADHGSHAAGAASRSAELWSEAGAANHRHFVQAHRGHEANGVLIHLARANVNRPIGGTPEWVDASMRNPDPNVQCASTASNLYRAAMKYARILAPHDDNSYRNLEQVLVSKWVATMTGAQLAVEIPRSQIKPGDAVVGEYDLNKHHGRNSDRHVGFVGDYNQRTHRWSAYSNSMGHLRLQDLDERFGHYREQHFYRLYFPH
jgi:hypothetical protein